MKTVALTLLAFMAGALPFSYWLGRLALGRDIRLVGDGNPGATNVMRAGGKASALIALALDFVKGALPVGLPYWSGAVKGWSLLPLALAPVLGHAFSPFLKGRGGKAVAVTGGVWCGLTAWEGPTIGGPLLAAATAVAGANGWAVVAAHSGVIAYTCLAPKHWNRLLVRPPANVLLTIGLCQLIVLAWKHRADFLSVPHS
jgi:glycerol-3-phosphate acyltransferase PlsY